MHLVPGRQADADAAQEDTQRGQFFVRRRRVHTVHRGLVALLQLLGRRHIGQHHELLDQPVAIQPRSRHHGSDTPRLVELHLALGQIEIQRAARLPRRQQGAIRVIQRRQRQVR